MARPAAHSTWGQRARGDECTYSTPRAVVVTMQSSVRIRCVFPYDLSNGDPGTTGYAIVMTHYGPLGKYAGRLAGITRSGISVFPTQVQPSGVSRRDTPSGEMTTFAAAGSKGLTPAAE